MNIQSGDIKAGVTLDGEGDQQPSPTARGPERSLDPDSQEDPDLCVELIDGVFHQLSKDNTLVAITADYPGLLPASKVTETEVPALSRGSIHALF